MIQTMFDILSDKCAGMTNPNQKIVQSQGLVQLDKVTQADYSKYSDQVSI